MGLIYLDTCLLIYFTEGDLHFKKKPVAKALREAADVPFGISALVKLECLVGPIRRADVVLQRAYSERFGMFETLSMPEPVYLLAAELRARFGLKTPDALHLACAQHHRCDALWTNDDRLKKASRGLARRIVK